MKPIKIKMQSFGSYAKATEIDFRRLNQNLFLVTGDTGAGKSTIFDAIVFALYGEASSDSNKKDGLILQSQYADYYTEPYVELTFSEHKGGEESIYTVKRIPRHLKFLTRGAGKGIATREVTSSVSLTMPDGSEYPSKETDKKLTEIVGLSKSQFMQVAMIAQGEFMELLRAKSDNKKEIFRKLFNTELYQKIIAEFAARKKAKEKDMAVLKTACSTAAAGVVIPDHYEKAALVNDLKQKLGQGQTGFMDEFVSELHVLCDWLDRETTSSQENYDIVSQRKDEKIKQLSDAQHLMKSYEQLDSAVRDIEEYKSKENAIRQTNELIEKLDSAYEIQSVYRLYEQAEDTVRNIKNDLAANRSILPEYEEQVRRANAAEKNANQEYHAALEHYNVTDEKVKRSLESFDKIRQLNRKKKTEQLRFDSCEKLLTDKKEEIHRLEQQEAAYQTLSGELSEASKDLALWEMKNDNVRKISSDVNKLIDDQKETEQKKKESEKLSEEYLLAKETYNRKRSEFEHMQQLFFDNQAGILALTLTDGKPCPVCGSLSHPSPFVFDDEKEEVSEETLNVLHQETEQFRTVQETLSSSLQSKNAVIQEREAAFRQQWTELVRKSSEYIEGLSDNISVQDFCTVVSDSKAALQSEGKDFKERVRKYEKAQDFLKSAETNKKQLRESYEEIRQQLSETTAALEAIKAEISTRSLTAEYETEEMAQSELRKAAAVRDQKQKEHQRLYNEAVNDKKKRDQTEARIQKLQNDLPAQLKQMQNYQQSYQDILAEKNLSSEEWQHLTQKYPREKIAVYRKKVKEYENKKAAADTKKETAEKSISGKPRPDLKVIEKEVQEIKSKFGTMAQSLQTYKSLSGTDRGICTMLSEKSEEHRKVSEEYTRLNALYQLVSGNISGSRMDLETFVQRYYLGRILQSANQRFLEMSAGNFELRMYPADKAGEGKNHGLDLMVYSNVTGKEREVRSLSGGESFMAALSLALGTADQIGENSSAVNLDMMFIDEGFGSLDEHSRNKAVRVLRDMAEGSKLIGIISHVSELKQEIDNRLIVSKDRNGSRACWQIS